MQRLAGEGPPSAPHLLTLCTRTTPEVATTEAFSWLISVPPAVPFSCLDPARAGTRVPVELGLRRCVRGDELSGLRCKDPARCWSWTPRQICTVREKSPSLPSCEVDAAGGKEKVTSTHPCRTPWRPGASRPTDPCHIPLRPRARTSPAPGGTTAAGAAGAHRSFVPLWHLSSWGCREWTPFLLCPCRGPGRVFGSLLLCLCFLYASFLFKCHRSLHQLISLYMDGI